MKHWEKTLIRPETSLREALQTIDSTGSQIALVVDAQRRLLGTLSDGDVRRALLRGMTLTDPVSEAMHRTPTCAQEGDERTALLAQMRKVGLHQIPLLDAERTVVGLVIVDDFINTPTRDNRVVIMAGGLGTRLAELTRHTPKPMLKVGSRPLLETIVRSYADQGFRRFYLAVNYKAEQIEQYFGDGRSLGVEIQYLRETKRMGTAGALSLLPEPLEQPLLVTNADLLTKEDYGDMVDQHTAAGAEATMGIRQYEMQVPFGVINENEGRILSIEEKPTQVYTVSAGMYVLSPQVLDLVPADRFFDMPSLFETMIARGMHARCHRIDGYWLDIGRLPDYERANEDFKTVFR